MSRMSCLIITGLKPLAPATFLGVQEGWGSLPPIELWNLTADLEGHPVGSTVSRETIEALGYYLSPAPEAARP